MGSVSPKAAKALKSHKGGQTTWLRERLRDPHLAYPTAARKAFLAKAYKKKGKRPYPGT